MGTSIKQIKTPPDWELEHNDYSSHRPLLWLCLFHVKKHSTVIEFGSGLGSTPLLRQYCAENQIQFYSFDTDKEWCEKTGAEFVNDFANIELKNIAVLFIDGKPGEQRKDLVEQHRETADLIVIHDTEPGAQGIYGTTEVLKSFKYRLDYQPEGNPHTTVLSDRINVEKWVKG